MGGTGVVDMVMKVYHKNDDITEIVENLTWSGDYKQAARKVGMNIVVSPHDKYLPRVNIAMGDMVQVFLYGKEAFRGYVFFKEKSIDGSQMNVTVYDGLIYMLKSKATYNVKGETPGALTKRICKEFGIETGNIIEGSPITRIFEGVELYNIIMTAYTMEYEKTGKPYMPVMKEGKLHIVEKGIVTAQYTLDAGVNLINATYSQSMEDSINRVQIYSEEGAHIGTVNLPASEGVVGILQDVYKAEKGADATAKAKAMLKGLEDSASVEALGDVECVAGNAVVVRESYTGLGGLFWIDTDEHRFENGQHFMSLGLAYKNLMDEQSAGSDPEEEKASESSNGGGSFNGTASANVNATVLKWKSAIEKYAKEFGVLEYVPLILALIQQESGGRYTDVMQASECGYNTRYSRAPNSIKDSDYSIWCGVQEFRDAIQKAGVKSPADMQNIKLALQGYNFGPAWLPWAQARGGYSKTNAKEFSRIWAIKMGWSKYGDVNYVDNVLRYYSVTEGSSSSSGATGKRQAFIKAAESFAGWKYSQPQRMSSYAVDCSSLVGRAMVKVGLTTNAFVTTRSMVTDNRFQKISKSQIQPGDILWQSGHVGVFLGNNRLIEAANSKQGVIYSKLGNRFTCGYRIRGIDG